jgi:hypothetical protein
MVSVNGNDYQTKKIPPEVEVLRDEGVLSLSDPSLPKNETLDSYE